MTNEQAIQEAVTILRRLEARAAPRENRTPQEWAALPFLISGVCFREFTGLNHDDFTAFIREGRIHKAPLPPPREGVECGNPKFYKVEMLQFILPPAQYAVWLQTFVDISRPSQTAAAPLPAAAQSALLRA